MSRKRSQIAADLSEDLYPTKKRRISNNSQKKPRGIIRHKGLHRNGFPNDLTLPDVRTEISQIKEESKAEEIQKLVANYHALDSLRARSNEVQTLPDELLIQIFSYLASQKELTAVGLTCRQCNRLSHDKSFGWMELRSFLLEDSLYWYLQRHRDLIPNAAEDDTNPLLAIQCKAALLARVSSLEPVKIARVEPQKCTAMYNKHGEIIHYVTERHRDNPWDEFHSDPELWSYSIRALNAQQVQEYCAKMNTYAPKADSWLVELKINLRRLEQLVLTKQRIPGLENLYNSIYVEYMNRTNRIMSMPNSAIPRRAFVTQPQPDGFKSGIELKKNQLEAVSWMMSIESTKAIPYYNAYSWPGARTNLMFSFKDHIVREQAYHRIVNVDQVLEVACPRGAILAGLDNKTEVIGLILALLASEQLPQHENLFSTRATLILTSEPLTNFWTEEITRLTHLKVADVSHIRQLKKYSYEDLLNYDVVIASYQLFDNQQYQDIRGKWKDSKKSFVLMKNKVPVLEQFLWHRLVLDEGHEYISKEQYVQHFKSLYTRFAWYVTGAPFPTVFHKQHLKQFVGIQSSDRVTTQEEHILTDVMLRELFWRLEK